MRALTTFDRVCMEEAAPASIHLVRLGALLSQVIATGLISYTPKVRAQFSVLMSIV